MSYAWFRKPVILIPAVCLAALVIADFMQVARPSLVAAVQCPAEFVTRTPDAPGLVARYHETIAAEAAAHDLPPELLAALIVNHQIYIPPWRRFTDCAGSAMGANLSLGLAQLRLSTAAQLDGRAFESLSPGEFRSLRRQLLEPPQNIVYEARELRSLLDRKNRYPGMGAETLIRDPFVMALVMTEYHMGRMTTASEDSRLSANAFNALRLLAEETLDSFGRADADVAAIRSKVVEYLSYVYCDSGIFNAGVCTDWREQAATL